MTLAEIEAYVNTKIAQNKGLDDQNKELVDKKEKLNRSIISLEAKNSELKKTHDLILAQNNSSQVQRLPRKAGLVAPRKTPVVDLPASASEAAMS